MSAWIEQPTGLALTTEEANDVTVSNATRVIMLAGPSASGKTTLLATLYQQFLEGPYAGYLFAGSATLHGFEQRCSMARTSSDLQSPDTGHTSLSDGIKFLHLKVRKEGGQESIRDLLITDWSGEVFQLAKNSTEYCRSLTVLPRCDHVAIVVDGSQLAMVDGRHRAQADANMLLQRFLDSGMVGQKHLVDVIFTKWDIVKSSESTTDYEDFISNLQETFENQHGARVGRLQFRRVAARPTEITSGVTDGFGLDGLFRSWVEECPALVLSSSEITQELPVGREIDKYVWTHV